MHNLALPSTTSPSSSSPEKDSDEDSLNQQYERASAFRSTMEDIKKRLKTKRGYESAVQDLLGQIDSELNFENKRVFYDCLNIISHRVGKPGFSASVAKPLFDAAWSKNYIFTPGFRKNIGDWKNTIDSLVSNPSSTTPSIERTDGRFGSRKTTTTTPKKRSAVDYNLAHLVLLRQFVEDFSDSDDDDSDDLVSVNNSQLSNLLAPSPFRTNSNSEIPYPFAYEVTDLPAPMAIMSIKHSPNPITVNYSFFLTDKHIGRCKGTAKIMICVYAAGTHHKTAAEYPKSVLYEINGEDVPNTPDGNNKYFTGIDVTGKCHVGKNSLTIKTFNCVCSYEFSVRIVDIKSLEHIAKDITQNKTIDYTRSLQRVISSFNTGGDIVQLSSRVSLRCPLSQARIAKPARGNECRHIQCFDLDTYLTLNKNNPKFKCPVCSRSVSTSELVIDSFFKSLLEDSSLQSTDEVEILPDGKWKAPESRGKRKSPFEAETPTKRQYIIAENAPSPIQKPQTTKPLAPVKIEIIDLT